jgi:hypothetical protein
LNQELRKSDTPAGILFGDELKAKDALREIRTPEPTREMKYVLHLRQGL